MQITTHAMIRAVVRDISNSCGGAATVVWIDCGKTLDPNFDQNELLVQGPESFHDTTTYRGIVYHGCIQKQQATITSMTLFIAVCN